jgi:hypothetical protein
MSTSPQHDQEAHENISGSGPGPWNAGSRRSLLGGAGGVALAASGLLLPDWLAQDADAADRPLQRVQDRKTRQRAQRRRRLERRRERNRRDDKQEDKSPGRDPLSIRLIEFIVEVTGPHPIKADLYWPRYRPGKPQFWDLKGSKSVAPSAKESFAAGDIDAALWLDDRILVRAANEPILEPTLKVGHGGAFWAGERGWEGGTVVFDDRLLKDQGTPAFSLGGYGVRVVRVSDSDDYIRYNVLVSAP